jgi:hypothetical protein
MAEITPQKALFTGTDVTLSAATATGDFATLTKDTGYEFRANNGSGAPITVTITAVQTSNQGKLNNQVITVGAGAEVSAKIKFYVIDAQSDRVDITYSAVGSLTVGIVGV